MSTSGDKRKITASRSTKEYASYFFDFALRRILTVNLKVKLVVYVAIVTGLSIFGDVQRPGAGYFSNKHNILNQYFVKLGWGWTLLAVISLLVITNMIQHRGEIKDVFYPIVRLTALTVIWYVSTHSFEWIENYTGNCTNHAVTVKRACLREGFNWLGFDISGHCFLMTFSLTIFNEESQVLGNVFKKLDAIERKTDERPSENLIILPSTYRLLLRCSMLLLVFLTFLWEFMSCVTALYFHTTAQKILGQTVAIIGWALVYKSGHLSG